VGDIFQFPNQLLMESLAEISSIATSLLKRYRPDIYSGVSGIYKDIFGPFNLFFGVRGTVCQHTDFNDVISVIFPIRTVYQAKGGLEIGGSSLCFNSQPGDVILLDSDLLSHGVPQFDADPIHRMVGIFIIQKSFLRLHGLKVNKDNILVKIK